MELEVVFLALHLQGVGDEADNGFVVSNFIYGVAHTPEGFQGMAICTIWGLPVNTLSIQLQGVVEPKVLELLDELVVVNDQHCCLWVSLLQVQGCAGQGSGDILRPVCSVYKLKGVQESGSKEAINVLTSCSKHIKVKKVSTCSGYFSDMWDQSGILEQ